MKKPIKPKKPVAPKKPKNFSTVTKNSIVRIYDGDSVMSKIRVISDEITSAGMIFDADKVYLESSYYDDYEDYETFLKYSDTAKIVNPSYESQLKAYEKKLAIYKAKLDLYNKAIEKYNSEMEEYQRLADLKTIEELKKRGFKIEIKT